MYPYTHTFRSTDDELQARKYLTIASKHHLAPTIIEWGELYVILQKCQSLREWVSNSTRDEIQEMQPKIIAMIQGIHALGICHRDLHIDNVLVSDGTPLAIDFEQAIDILPSVRCYDLFGPSSEVPLLPAHLRWGGVLGADGMWWGAKLDPRWDYQPMGHIFGKLVATRS